jgi:hypothetical protein
VKTGSRAASMRRNGREEGVWHGYRAAHTVGVTTPWLRQAAPGSSCVVQASRVEHLCE